MASSASTNAKASALLAEMRGRREEHIIPKKVLKDFSAHDYQAAHDILEQAVADGTFTSAHTFAPPDASLEAAGHLAVQARLSGAFTVASSSAAASIQRVGYEVFDEQALEVAPGEAVQGAKRCEFFDPLWKSEEEEDAAAPPSDGEIDTLAVRFRAHELGGGGALPTTFLSFFDEKAALSDWVSDDTERRFRAWYAAPGVRMEDDWKRALRPYTVSFVDVKHKSKKYETLVFSARKDLYLCVVLARHAPAGPDADVWTLYAHYYCWSLQRLFALEAPQVRAPK